MPSSAAARACSRCTRSGQPGSPPRPPPSPTAAEQYDFLILSQWSDAADSQRNIEWTRALFEAMRPHLEDAVYVNEPRATRARAGSGLPTETTNPRLAAIKKKPDDPDNLFRGEPEHRATSGRTRWESNGR